MIDQTDVSDSSESLSDFYNSNEDVDCKESIRQTLNELLVSETSRLDSLLLKGFYTSNRIELGNPPLAYRKKRKVSASKEKRRGQLSVPGMNKFSKSAPFTQFESFENQSQCSARSGGDSNRQPASPGITKTGQRSWFSKDMIN